LVLHAIIKGIVQGVGYRYFTRNVASRMGIKGWVKNLSDGSVEVMAEADENKLKEFLKYLYEGPPLSKVEKIDYEFLNENGGFKDFEIRY